MPSAAELPRAGWRRLAAPAAATMLATAILIGLGIWQLERLHWKRGLLAEIAAAENAPPAPLGATVPRLFTRVSVAGTLRPQAALYGAEVRGEGRAARMGAQQLQVLDRPDAAPILVDLGWVPAERGALVHPLKGPVSLTGYVRLPEHPGWLSAPDDPGGRHFYALDPAAIGVSLAAPDVEPLTLVALGGAAGEGPVPAAELPRPVNNHFQYALTWFGLAGALLVVAGASALKGLRRRVA